MTANSLSRSRVGTGHLRTAAVLLLDDLSIARWQRRALAHASSHLEIALIISCRNTRTKRRPLRHGLYYLTSLATLRGGLAHRDRFESDGIPVLEFNADSEGGWQRLPRHVEEAIVASGASAVIKFGMSLLRVPDDNDSFPPVLSFHHGDPREFRGRPAGFFEILQGASTAGVIVQSITNRLDAGDVWAECKVRIIPWSYRRTLHQLYARSESLLGHALRGLSTGERVEVHSVGPVFTLPDNVTVVRFWLLLGVRRVRRLVYGAFVEKRWNVGIHPSFSLIGAARLDPLSLQQPEIPSRYSFLADPFPNGDQALVRAEAFNRRTGRGEIVELEGSRLRFKRVLLQGGHFSYPFTVTVGEREFIIPETAQHLPASRFEETAVGWINRPLAGLEDYRIVDPTLVYHGDGWFLFCGLAGTEGDELHLFHAAEIDGVFEPHPLNPIVVDPTRARMGGALLRDGDRLIRLGQDCSRSYGDGLSVCAIESLTPDEYREVVVGSVRFHGLKGPHTLNRIGDDFVVDFYREQLSPFAWWGRGRAAVSRRAKVVSGDG